MSLDTTTFRWTYEPNGISTSFPFDNLVLDAADLVVTWYAADGEALELPSHHVTGIGVASGGTVVFASPPAAVAGSLLILERRTGTLMGGGFGDYRQDSAKVQQERADRLFALIQEVRGLLGRALLSSPLDPSFDFLLPPPALRAGKALLFGPLPDAAPVVGELADPAGLVVSAFALQLLDDADAPAALGTLGFSSFMKDLRVTSSADALLQALGFTSYFRSTLLALTDANAWRAAITVAPAAVPVPLFDNAACQVKQQAGTTNLTTSPQHAKVDRFSAWANGGTVTAGTIGQNAASAIGRSGHSLHLAGVTLTGSGKLSVRQRIEAAQARQVRNASVSLAVAVWHDCAAPVSYTIRLSKAASADDFSSVTFIAASAAQPVAANTPSRIVFENVALGDCSAGLEVQIEADCGAITIKNLEFTEFVAAIAETAPPFASLRSYAGELAACQRFWEDGNASYNVAQTTVPNTIYVQVPFKATKRAVPSCAVSGGTIGATYVDSFNAYATAASSSLHVNFTWTADARFAP